MNQVCQELTGMMPALGGENANIPNALVSTVGFLRLVVLVCMPKTAFTTVLNALKVCKAVISLAELQNWQ